jgi:hypothetical protein
MSTFAGRFFVDTCAIVFFSNSCRYLHKGMLKGKYHCTIDLLFVRFGLACFVQIKTKIVSCHAANSKPVKQEVNSTVILPPF